VNSGIMKLTQAVGVILGANVGTTVTAWILSLTEVNGTSFFLQLLKPTSFSPVLAIVGVILISMGKKNRQKDIGTIMVGFAVLMSGMNTMSSAVTPLASEPGFIKFLLAFSNPVLGMLVGLVLTAVIQSSSASIGILQALSVTGAVSYSTAIPIILGANIGACATSLISGVGANRNGRRAALIHLYFNLIKTITFMLVFYTINAVVDFAFMGQPASALGIAVIHTAFNVVSVILIFPVSAVLEKLVILTIPISEEEQKEDRQDKNELQLLDARFLGTPSFALEVCKSVAATMVDISREALFIAIDMLDHYDEESAKKVIELENIVDHYDDEIGSYLVKLSSRHLTERDSQQLSVLLHSIGDFERISDHAINIMESAREMSEKSLSFSRKAQEELSIYTGAIRDIVNTSVKVFQEEDLSLAAMIEPMEEVIDYLSVEVKKRHMKRLRKGKCTIEMGFVLSDITTNYERVSDHCSNIALSLLQLNEENFETHEYQEAIVEKNSKVFEANVRQMKERYQLPTKERDR
ncbi:MAG: Na/Pi cotransporter family protein, partial [Lachnospiraceae bacterium]|nr:Na/Pi cotransporter family protein [Lachnospiraceae bacterium]